MNNNLTNKVALITGASRGIGEAIMLKLGKHGATVIGSATTKNGADNIAQKLTNNNIIGTGIKLDVCDDNQISSNIKYINDNYGSIDILINNAGITRDNLLMRMTDDEWDTIINTNLRSVYKMSKAVLRAMMKKKSGSIISIASVVGSMGNAGQTNYSAAKAGIIGFTKSLAREVGSRGITVNAIAPGFIQTDMTAKLTTEQQQKLIAQIPLAKLGTTENIADAALFLAADSGKYITAQTLHINGGMYTV